MIIKNCITAVLLLISSITFYAQSNTAVNSGSIGKCYVWEYPYTLYNNSGASQTISNGVTVTVDQNRNIGAVNLSGTGALEMSGANGVTFSGTGNQINCRWDIPAGGSHTVVNNTGSNNVSVAPYNAGNIFTAPYTGTYLWIRGTGWTANMTGGFQNGGVDLVRNADGAAASIFYQNMPGNCGLHNPATVAPEWADSNGPFSALAGQVFSYRATTAYTTRSACNNTTLTFTVGSALMIFNN